MLPSNRFVVLLHDTLAVLCVHWPSADPSVISWLSKACPTAPLPVRVELGDFDVDKGMFEGVIDAGEVPLLPACLTRYRKIPLSSL